MKKDAKHKIIPLNKKDAQKICKTLSNIINEIDERFMEYSSEKAEDIHHEECKLECCGEHEIGDDDKCVHCNMNDEEINDHNDEWWEAVDQVEADDEVCIEMREQMENLNKVIKALGGEEVGHH
jgi:hypothetical protein